MTGGPGGGPPIALNGSARKALIPASSNKSESQQEREDIV